MAWVNTTVYDYKSQLKTGAMTLFMWTYAEDMQNEDLLHPLGTVVSNPNIDQCATITIECSELVKNIFRNCIFRVFIFIKKYYL